MNKSTVRCEQPTHPLGVHARRSPSTRPTSQRLPHFGSTAVTSLMFSYDLAYTVRAMTLSLDHIQVSRSSSPVFAPWRQARSSPTCTGAPYALRITFGYPIMAIQVYSRTVPAFGANSSTVRRIQAARPLAVHAEPILSPLVHSSYHLGSSSAASITLG